MRLIQVKISDKMLLHIFFNFNYPAQLLLNMNPFVVALIRHDLNYLYLFNRYFTCTSCFAIFLF